MVSASTVTVIFTRNFTTVNTFLIGIYICKYFCETLPTSSFFHPIIKGSQGNYIKRCCHRLFVGGKIIAIKDAFVRPSLHHKVSLSWYFSNSSVWLFLYCHQRQPIQLHPLLLLEAFGQHFILIIMLKKIIQPGLIPKNILVRS